MKIILLCILVLIVSVCINGYEANKVLRERALMHYELQSTKQVLEAALVEIDMLRADREHLQRSLDDSVAFISQLRAEAMAINQSEERKL